MEGAYKSIICIKVGVEVVIRNNNDIYGNINSNGPRIDP